MEPVLGWRIWNLRDRRLESWAVDYCWEPGENAAICLAPHRRACATSPGLHCQCGFWAVWSPGQCLARACAAAEPPWHVMGLVVGWGTVALHGREGFRAERAALRCLFTDRPWSTASAPRPPSRLAGWWRRTTGRATAIEPAERAAPREPGHLDELEAVAAHYAVPLTSLAGAAALGLLSELGVPEAQVAEAARLAAGATTELG
jgi:hypothetical protein